MLDDDLTLVGVKYAFKAEKTPYVISCFKQDLNKVLLEYKNKKEIVNYKVEWDERKQVMNCHYQPIKAVEKISINLQII